MLVRTTVIIFIVVCISAACVQADRLQLQEYLGQNIKVKLNDVTIDEALAKIGQKADIKLVLSDKAEWKLPFGKATKLSVAIDGPLSDGLTETLTPLFMRYALGDEEVTIYPLPKLDHIIGRPTEKQLKLLEDIYSKTIKKFQESAQSTISQALGEYVSILPYDAQSVIEEIFRKMAGVNPYEPPVDELEFSLPRPVTVAQVLEQIEGRGFGGKAYWYIGEIDPHNPIPQIHIVSLKDFREMSLEQIIDISFTDVRADQIIHKLARWAGMELYLSKRAPEWLSEKISVDMQDTKLSQVMFNIISAADGEIRVNLENNGVFVRGPMTLEEPTPLQTAEQAPVVPLPAMEGSDVAGKITIPMDGGRYYIELTIREDDLTEELKNLRSRMIRELLTSSRTKQTTIKTTEKRSEKAEQVTTEKPATKAKPPEEQSPKAEVTELEEPQTQPEEQPAGEPEAQPEEQPAEEPQEKSEEDPNS